MNMVPFDKRSPLDPSGIRLGTPAVTTRGMKEKEMEIIAKWVNDVVENVEDKKTMQRVKAEVKDLCSNFPVPGIRI